MPSPESLGRVREREVAQTICMAKMDNLTHYTDYRGRFKSKFLPAEPEFKFLKGPLGHLKLVIHAYLEWKGSFTMLSVTHLNLI